MSVSNMSSSPLGEPPDLGSSAADGDRHPGRLPWDANLLSPAVAANEVVVAVDAVCYRCMFNFLHVKHVLEMARAPLYFSLSFMISLIHVRDLL